MRSSGGGVAGPEDCVSASRHVQNRSSDAEPRNQCCKITCIYVCASDNSWSIMMMRDSCCIIRR